MAGKATFTELETCVTIPQLLKINAIMDMQADIENYYHKKHEDELKQRDRR